MGKELFETDLPGDEIQDFLDEYVQKEYGVEVVGEWVLRWGVNKFSLSEIDFTFQSLDEV